jgi:hypothetical protein
MGTAHATLIFVSSMLGPCIAWMAGIHLRFHANRQSVPATFAARGFSQVPGEFDSLRGPDRAGEVKP